MSGEERGGCIAVALTGTPGVGKSTAASRFFEAGASALPGLRVREVSDLVPVRVGGARREGSRTRPPGKEPRTTVVVDLERASLRLSALRKEGTPLLVVGHLAHLLPVDRIALLRCAPIDLGDRLRSRGDSEAAVQANMEAEWTDLILFESLRSGRPVYEHDTTRETPDATAHWILGVFQGSVEPSHGTVDWLGAQPPGLVRPGKPISRRRAPPPD